MPTRVLMVCVGNVCRSPMAAALLQRRFDEAGVGGVVDSAGIAAMVGAPAQAHAVTLMNELGLDVSGHRARQIDAQITAAADLVLTMERTQMDWIETRWPQMRGRVHLLGKWDSLEVPDPMGGSVELFRDCVRLIEVGVGSWATRVAARSPG